MASLSSKRSLFRYEIMQQTVVVPSSATDLTTTDTIVYQIVISNVTASAANFSFTDKQSSPLDIFKTVSIAANSVAMATFPEGLLMKGGITWLSGTASALNAQVFGLYK